MVQRNIIQILTRLKQLAQHLRKHRQIGHHRSGNAGGCICRRLWNRLQAAARRWLQSENPHQMLQSREHNMPRRPQYAAVAMRQMQQSAHALQILHRQHDWTLLSSYWHCRRWQRGTDGHNLMTKIVFSTATDVLIGHVLTRRSNVS